MDYIALSRTAKRLEQRAKVNDEMKESLQKVVTVLRKV